MNSQKRIKSDNWLNPKVNELTNILSQHLDYLTEPNSRKKIGKIRNDLERTIHKIKRKKSDRFLLIAFKLITSTILAALFFNLNEYSEIYIIISSILFLSMGYLVFNKLLLPIHKDLKYLCFKEKFLKAKMNEVSHSLRQESESTVQNKHKSQKSYRSIPDF